MWKGIFFGTIAFMLAASASVVLSVMEKRGVPTIPIVSAVIILALGGLTLAVDEAAFIKMQPTVANGLFAIVIAAGTLAGRNLLRRSFSPALGLTDTGWRRLAWYASGYLGCLTVLNEIVWRSATTETWVYFKTFGILPANVMFGLLLIPFVRAHWSHEIESVREPEKGGCSPQRAEASRAATGR